MKSRYYNFFKFNTDISVSKGFVVLIDLLKQQYYHHNDIYIKLGINKQTKHMVLINITLKITDPKTGNKENKIIYVEDEYVNNDEYKEFLMVHPFDVLEKVRMDNELERNNSFNKHLDFIGLAFRRYFESEGCDARTAMHLIHKSHYSDINLDDTNDLAIKVIYKQYINQYGKMVVSYKYIKEIYYKGELAWVEEDDPTISQTIQEIIYNYNEDMKLSYDMDKHFVFSENYEELMNNLDPYIGLRTFENNKLYSYNKLVEVNSDLVYKYFDV